MAMLISVLLIGYFMTSFIRCFIVSIRILRDGHFGAWNRSKRLRFYRKIPRYLLQLLFPRTWIPWLIFHILQDLSHIESNWIQTKAIQNTFTWIYAFFRFSNEKYIIFDLMENFVSPILLVFDHQRIFFVILIASIITDQRLVFASYSHHCLCPTYLLRGLLWSTNQSGQSRSNDLPSMRGLPFVQKWTSQCLLDWLIILRRSKKKKDVPLKPDFDSLPVVWEKKFKKGFKALVHLRHPAAL